MTGFDLQSLGRAVAEHGAVARVMIADFAGSSPRETGTAMLVWATGQSGTVGGGALEYQATQAARDALGQPGRVVVATIPLGPALGQCCGGSVTLVTEVFDADTMPTCDGVFARSLQDPGDIIPLAPKRAMADLRAGARDALYFGLGWLVEPLRPKRQSLWIYGAGHVGRALVSVCEGLDFDITWVDTSADRYPAKIPGEVTQLIAQDPSAIVSYAPDDAHHLILTYSHTLDLELCHQLLSRPAASIGLIGSATKWARFQRRLAALGHAPAQISRITCPIGRPSLGKSPKAIAVGVVGDLLSSGAVSSSRGEVLL